MPGPWPCETRQLVVKGHWGEQSTPHRKGMSAPKSWTVAKRLVKMQIPGL